MSTDSSDWDPLPEGDAARFPGEAAALQPRSAAARPVAVAEAAAAGDREPAMPGLQSSVAAQASALVAMMQVPAPPPVARKPEAPAAPARERAPGDQRRAEVAAVDESTDAREREAWFRAMPVLEQDRLRRAWQAERPAPAASAAPAGTPTVVAGAPADRQRVRSQELLEWFWVAYVVFFVAALPLMLTEGLAGFVRMAMAGCITGMVWQVVPRTRFSCVASAVAVYCAVVIAPRFGELVDTPFDLMVSLAGAVLVGYLASLGAMHEEKLAALRPSGAGAGAGSTAS
ncbi:MAG: hypothetical protein AB7O97_13095 [Planctomycetota bacterium]